MHNRINHDFSLKNTGVTNAFHSMDRPRHRWYYYKEGFSPVLVEKAIELTGVTAGDIILDPFNGSGTTTLTASAKGIKSVGIEVNPFTSFLAKAKTRNADLVEFDRWTERIIKASKTGRESPLLGYSTFSKTDELSKWLFNDAVLRSFEGGWHKSASIGSYNVKALVRLALIVSAMRNCNAKRDGKCLRYRKTWAQRELDSDSYVSSLELKLGEIRKDIEELHVDQQTTVINGDVRKVLASVTARKKFKLCITSPPYLNTFDYTDIYRPELFLGRFVKSTRELYKLRLRTVRSHIQAKWKEPVKSDFGILYDEAIKHVLDENQSLMAKRIPSMVQAYFEDMTDILRSLKKWAAKDAQLWMVVSNSAYANYEIPVDLIIADIGSKLGWSLKDVAVLENIKRRKTKHSPDISTLRESVVIFRKEK
jgi:DNA modification methylase